MTVSTIIAELKLLSAVILYPAATEQQIRVFEEQTGLILPADLKMFYSCSNGFAGAEELFRIIPLEEMLENWQARSKLEVNQFDIAEYLIYADVWHIEISGRGAYPYTIFYLTPEEKKVPLTNSLAEFLSHFLVGGVYEQNGLYDWMKFVDPHLRLFI